MRDERQAQADALICAILRGAPCAWRQDADFQELVVQRAQFHGVAGLLHERFSADCDAPPTLRTAMRDRAIAQTFWELRDQSLLAQAVRALSAEGVTPILFKGAALAYALYSNPALRARADADMIVAPEQFVTSAAVLRRLGFEAAPAAGGAYSQQTFSMSAREGGDHAIDLHWRINNSEVLARLFSYAQLRASAVALPHFDAPALMVDEIHALLLACLHRATHQRNPYYVAGIGYDGSGRLIWLYDIHLLAERFTQPQWRAFVALARAKGACATSLGGLEQASACFATPVPADVRQALTTKGERVAAYLAASPLRQALMDCAAIDSFAGRLRFLRAIVFPPAAYMRDHFSAGGAGWLPWLYLRRAFGGLAKRLRAAREET